jgi:hypothetical protein
MTRPSAGTIEPGPLPPGRSFRGENRREYFILLKNFLIFIANLTEYDLLIFDLLPADPFLR